MNRVRFIALALLAAAAMVLGGATKSTAHGPPAGPPDTYVAAWDAIGSQAFTAAALTPADRSLRLGDGSRGRVSTLRGRGRRTRGCLGRGVGCGSGPPHPRALPAGSGANDPRSRVRGIARHDPERPGEDRRRRHRRGCRRPPHRRARGRRLPGTGDVHAPEPANPRAVDPDSADAADRHLPRADGTVSASSRPTSSARVGRPHSRASGGRASTTRSRRSARARARHEPPSRRWRRGSGRSLPCSRRAAPSASSSSTTISTSSRRRG